MNTKLIWTCVALLASATSLDAQITTTMSSTTVKSSVEQPVAISADARHAFEVSLQGVANYGTPTSPPFAALAWNALPTASSYVVLRSAQLAGASVATPVGDALNHHARILPGNYFYFRVVALNSRGAALDTTSAVSVFIQPIQPIGTGGAAESHVGLTCNLVVPSGIALSWQKPGGADDAVVNIMLLQNGRWVSVASSTQTGTTYSQSGLPAGNYQVLIRLYYTLHDYPAPGQSTSAFVGEQSTGATVPVTAAGPCH